MYNNSLNRGASARANLAGSLTKAFLYKKAIAAFAAIAKMFVCTEPDKPLKKR